MALPHQQGLIVGAKRFTGHRFDGHTLAAQIGQTNTLINTSGKAIKETYVDLGFRGVDADNPRARVMHRGAHQINDEVGKEALEATPGGGAGDWAREAR